MDMLAHVRKVVEAIWAFKEDGLYYIEELLANEKLWEDYYKGSIYLKRIRHDLELEEDGFIKELIEICVKDAEYLGKYHYKTGVVKEADLNKKSIEFLLRLYYSRKLGNAQRDTVGRDINAG